MLEIPNQCKILLQRLWLKLIPRPGNITSSLVLSSEMSLQLGQLILNRYWKAWTLTSKSPRSQWLLGLLAVASLLFWRCSWGRSRNVLARSLPASIMPHIVVSHHGSRSVQSKKILLVHRHGIDPGTTRLPSRALYNPISNNFLRVIRQKSAFPVLV